METGTKSKTTKKFSGYIPRLKQKHIRMKDKDGEKCAHSQNLLEHKS